MKSTTGTLAAIAAASLFSTAGLAAAVPAHDARGVVARTPQQQAGSKFQVRQVPNKKFNHSNKGPRARAKPYNKFAVEMPADLAKALAEITEAIGDIVEGVATGDASKVGEAADDIIGALGIDAAAHDSSSSSSTTYVHQMATKTMTSTIVGAAPTNNAAVDDADSITSTTTVASSYAVSTTSTSTSTVAKAQGTVGAQLANEGSEYLSPVQVGTPPQTLMLDFDTGSSDLWVFSSETLADQMNGQTIYNISQSSTAKHLDGLTWSIAYGDGSTSSGDVYSDIVSIGGVSVQEQAIETAQNVSSSFKADEERGGLLGLAMDNLNKVKPDKQKTFFSNIIDTLAEPVFTVNFQKSTGGLFNFGYIDDSEYEGSLNYVPLNGTNGYWEITGSGYKVDGADAAVEFSHQAIVDTGTSLLLLPPALVVAYWATVPNATMNSAGGYSFACGTELPPFSLMFDGYEAVIAGSDIDYGPIKEGSSTCYGGIQVDTGLPFAIYGDIFLRSVFTVFDGANSRVGFAPKAAAAATNGTAATR